MFSIKPSLGCETVSSSSRFYTVLRSNLTLVALGLLMCMNAFGHTVGGYIQYHGSGSGLSMVPGVSVCRNGSNCVNTNSEGYWEMTGVSTGSYTFSASKTGDDGAITSGDSTRVTQGVTNQYPFLNDSHKVACDSSMNGVNSSYDATLIGQFISSPPAGHVGEWHFYIDEGWPTFPLNGSPETDTYYIDSNFGSINFNAILIGDCDRSWSSE